MRLNAEERMRCRSYLENGEFNTESEEHKLLLELIDSMEVEEVDRGNWIEKKVKENVDDHNEPIIPFWQSAKCSVCGRYHTTPYLYYFDMFRYCPNCGSTMNR